MGEDIPVKLYYTMILKALTSKTGIDVFKTDRKTAAIPSPIPDPIMIISRVEHHDKYAVLIHL